MSQPKRSIPVERGPALTQLLDKIADRSATVGVIGQGYVGLPLAVVVAEAGFDVTGYDIAADKVAQLNEGSSYIGDIPDERLKAQIDAGLYRARAAFDDLGAIIVIAVFYTADLSLIALMVAAVGTLALVVLNRAGIRAITPYVLIGLVVWVGVLKSGVHATLAGVVVALCIPLASDVRGHSPLRWLEHALHPWVAYLVLPVFAFVNAGVPFTGLDPALLVSAVPLGIATGLFLGKQAGVFLICWVAIRAGLASLPEGASWRSFYAVCALAGIGFTMSLFIGNLAFERGAFEYVGATRIGVLLGSLASALLGAALLFGVPRRARD